MSNRDKMSLIKNVYDDETLDAIKSLDQNVNALMHHNPIYKDVMLDQYTRVPLTPGSSDSQIRMDVSKAGKRGFFFLSEAFIVRLNESEEIRSQLIDVMKRIKMVLKL
jgi:hypothetical protein